MRGRLGIFSSFLTSGLFINLFPNAAIAFSLRRLSNSYTGSAIRVRRSSDNTEQDIGFVNNVLDTDSLTTFVGAGSGFVTTWYDQSGFNRDAVQTTSNNQPQIIIEGSLQISNNKPSLRNGTTRHLGIQNAGDIFRNANKGLIMVVSEAESNSRAEFKIFFSTGTSSGNARFGIGRLIQQERTVGRRLDNDSLQSVFSTNTTSGSQLIHTGFIDWENAKAYQYINNSLNGTSDPFQTSGNTSNTTGLAQVIFGIGTQQNFFGKIQEIFVYSTDEFNNIENMNNQINDFYGTY